MNIRALLPFLLVSTLTAGALRAQDDVARLVTALLGPTPMLEDLGALTDGIGGRPTGSEANLAAVDWALARFRAAGVDARREAFQMPAFATRISILLFLKSSMAL